MPGSSLPAGMSLTWDGSDATGSPKRYAMLKWRLSAFAGSRINGAGHRVETEENVPHWHRSGEIPVRFEPGFDGDLQDVADGVRLHFRKLPLQ